MDRSDYDDRLTAEENRNLERQKAARRALKTGEWACLDAKCSHINQEFRNTCDKCGKPKARAKNKIGREIGKDAAEKSKGLFAAEDWSCTKCGNINWARRNTCNICNAPKLGDLERRTGYGGGYMDREDVEYIDREDDDEFDEFGRKKKKQRATAGDSSSAYERRAEEAMPSSEQVLNEKENEQDEDEDESGDDANLDKYALDDDDEEDDDLEKYDLTADPEVAAVVQTQSKDSTNGDDVRAASPLGRADSRVSSDCSCSCSGGECSCEESDDSREPRTDHREKERDRRRPARPRSRSRSRSPRRPERQDRDRRHRR